jgi:hypothetical protein
MHAASSNAINSMCCNQVEFFTDKCSDQYICSYARDGTDINQEEQHYNRQQHLTVHKGHPRKETSGTNTSKEKPKKKHKNKVLLLLLH